MANDLIQKNAELGRFLFCERYTLQPVKNALYIAEGQDLKRGAVVDVNGVLVGTNSLMPYAVLENDCDTRAKGAFASVFVKGEFNFDKMFFADGLSKENLDLIVYNGSKVGILIKPYTYSSDFSPKSDDIDELIPEDASKDNKLVDELQLYKELHRVTNGGTMLVGAKVGDILWVDPANGDKYFLDKSVYHPSKAEADGLESVGVVYWTEGRKLGILHKDESDSLKFSDGWLFKIEGINTDGTNANVITLQKFNGTNTIGVEVGTYDDTADKPTTLASFVEGFDAYLRSHQTTEGAVTYNWHCEIMPDADGVDSAFIVIDSNTDYRQVSVNPVKSSTTGASSTLYMWQFSGQTTNRTDLLRNDGVTTYACLWNKERFKQNNANVNNPTDSLSSGGIFSQSNFNATNCPTVYAEYDGDYDKYLDAMLMKWPSSTGSQASFAGTGHEIGLINGTHQHKKLDGSLTFTFPSNRYSYTRATDATKKSDGLGDGAWFLPDIVEGFKLLNVMKLDGSDAINSSLVAIGKTVRSLSVSRWVSSRCTSYSGWVLYSPGATTDFAFINSYSCCSVALLEY